MESRQKTTPETAIGLGGRGVPTGGGTHGSRPVVRLRVDAEARCGIGFANAPCLENDAEKREVGLGDVVQPVQRRPVFIAELLGDQDGDPGVETCGIRD